MQKDIHNGATGLITLLAGFTPEQAAEIAYFNQYTDENTDAREYGIATAVNYNLVEVLNKTIQQFIIVAFHALPGDDPKNKWIVTPNCILAQRILQDAVDRKCRVAFGMALHALQDTFSHQSFTGWQDGINANPSLNLLNVFIPRILHAEFLMFPDDVGATWERNGVQVVNKIRAKEACLQTFIWSRKFLGLPCTPDDLENVTKLLEPFWKIKTYDNRKKWLKEKSGLADYSNITPTQEGLDKFASAARRQISKVMEFVGADSKR